MQSVEIGLDEIDGSKVKELKKEVKAHGVKADSGRKADLQKALREHLNLYHVEEEEQESESHQDLDLDWESEPEQNVVHESAE